MAGLDLLLMVSRRGSDGLHPDGVKPAMGEARSGIHLHRQGVVCQKTVAQSFLMLTIVQPLLPARSSACSAPLV